MDELIEARHKEVFAAKDAIAKMESVIEGLKERNQHQKEQAGKEIDKLKRKSEEEISKLQEEIGNLLNTIKEKEKELGTFKEKEQNVKNFLKKQRDAELKKLMDGQNSVNPSIQDEQERIKQLNSVINKLRLEIHVLEESEDQRATELQHAKNEIERQVELSKTAIQNKDNELKREIDL